MVKYKCPNCGTLYDAVPISCVICGAEFAPAGEQDQPKSTAEPAPEVVPAPAPVVEEAPAPEVKEETKVEEPKEEEKVEEKVEEKQENAPQYNEASEINISSKQPKAKISPRVFIGFGLAWVMIISLAICDVLPFMRGSAPETRVYICLITAGLAFGAGLATLIVTGNTDRYERFHAMAVAARVLGTIFFVIACFNLVAWATIGAFYIGSDTLSPSMGFDWKATIDNFFTTGQFALVKYVAPVK